MWASMRARSRAVSAASIAAERLGYACAAINASSWARRVSGTVAVTLLWVRAMGFLPPEQQKRSKHRNDTTKDHIKNKGATKGSLCKEEATCLRAGPRRDALFLRILGRRRHQGPHQRLVRGDPVGDRVPLRAVPLLELHASTPLMIATGEGDWWEQALCPQLLERRWREGEVVESPLHLWPRQWLVAKFPHGRAQRLRGENALQHTTYPTCRADITFRTSPPAPGIDVLEHILDERKVSPRAVPDRANEANGRLPGRHHVLLRAGRERPHDLVAGEANLGRFLQGRRGHPALRRMTQLGWATLTRSQVAFWSSPGGGTARCWTTKPYWAAWVSRMA